MSLSAGKIPNMDNHWWWGKKRARRNRINRKLDGLMKTELVGDNRIYSNKPVAWSSTLPVGMDKIRAKTAAGRYFVEFASSVSIHGVNHMVAPHRHPIEKFLALLFIAGALVALILLSLNFWNRYLHNATTVNLDIDFRNFVLSKPSITICPHQFVDSNRFPEVFKKYGVEDTVEAREFFKFLDDALYATYAETPLYDGVSPDKFLDILWDLRGNMVTKNEEEPIWVVTDHGICASYSSYAGIYASYLYWKADNWSFVVPSNEISFVSYLRREEIYMAQLFSHNMSVSIQHPYEVMSYEQTFHNVYIRNIFEYELIPEEIKTTKLVKELSISQRMCKALHEGGLKLWPVYTRNMCNLECKYDELLEKCGCYPHYVRPMPGVPVCSAVQLRCVGENYRDDPTLKSCVCLENCDTTNYEEYLLIESLLKEGSPAAGSANFHLDFPTSTLCRDLLFGFNDFLTSVGGAAGLFLGASVISFVEVLYFATLRLVWYIVAVRRNRRSKLKLQQRIASTKKKLVSSTLEISPRPAVSSFYSYEPVQPHFTVNALQRAQKLNSPNSRL